MQTFLPFADFQDSAYALHPKHLGKQRVENLQIMTALLEGHGWIHHPVTKMWAGHEWTLLMYQKAICEEWTENFGYKDTCWQKTQRVYFLNYRGGIDHIPPAFIGDPAFHLSHQSNLVRKKPEYYGPQFPGVSPELPYIYPKTHEE